MKKLITAAALLWAMAGTLSAQTVTGPEHPLNMKTKRSIADSTTCETYLSGGGTNIMYPLCSSIHRYNKDWLTDTTTHQCGLLSQTIQKYSPDGHLLYRSTYVSKRIDTDGNVYPEKEFNVVKYNYGKDGRLLKEEHYDRLTDKPTKGKLYESLDYQYTMTDSGYVLSVTERLNIDTGKDSIAKHKVEILLDKKGRVTVWKIKDKQAEEAYVTGDDGKRYRVGDTYYSYTDSSYSSVSFKRGGKELIRDQITPDRWYKHDYIFNKKGLQTKKRFSIRPKDSKEWKMWDIEGYFYFYKDGNPHSNIRIGKASGRVYGTVGGAVVETEQTVEAAVYTFGGQPVKRQRIGAGTTRIPLPAGFYLITLNGTGHKVIVK